MRRVVILGSTGSIGTQALEVIAANRDRFEIVGLAAGSNRELIAEQAREFGVVHTAIGADEAEQLARSVDADVVLNGITGSVGLLLVLIVPTLVDQLRPGDGALRLHAMGVLILVCGRSWPHPRIPLAQRDAIDCRRG